MKKTMIYVLALAIFGFFVPVASAESAAKDMLDPMASNDPQENTAVNAPATSANTAASPAKVEKTKTQGAQKSANTTKAKSKKQKKSTTKKNTKHPKKKHATSSPATPPSTQTGTQPAKQ